MSRISTIGKKDDPDDIGNATSQSFPDLSFACGHRSTIVGPRKASSPDLRTIVVE
jgi:hypothetical protein